MRIFLLRVLLLLILVALPIAVYIKFHKNFVKLFRNDDARHFLIAEYLDTAKSSAPTVIFFGSSFGMKAVDANILDSVDNVNTYYNLSSSAQSTAELVHFLQNLPPGTKEVVFCQDVTFLAGTGRYTLSKNKSVSMSLAGFNTGEFELKFIDSFNNNAGLRPGNILHASLGFRASLHIFLRDILDKHQKKEFNSANSWSLKHPHYYNSERIYNYKDRMPAEPKVLKNNLGSTKVETHTKIQQYLASRGIKYTILLVPMNPEYFDLSLTKDYKTELHKMSSINVIDFTRKLEPIYFYDNGHLNKKGSRVLTKLLWEEYFNSDSAQILNKR